MLRHFHRPLDPKARVEFMRDILASLQRKHGNESPSATSAMEGLANSLYEARELDEAIILRLSALDNRRKYLGPEDRDIYGAELILGRWMAEAGRFAEAVPFLTHATSAPGFEIDGDRKGHLNAVLWLGESLRKLNRQEEALQVFERARDGYRVKYGENDPTTLRATAEAVRYRIDE
ncbi:MAG: tetratricopeptide repeat protein [Acidimicrobiales bacterium]